MKSENQGRDYYENYLWQEAGGYDWHRSMEVASRWLTVFGLFLPGWCSHYTNLWSHAFDLCLLCLCFTFQ